MSRTVCLAEANKTIANLVSSASNNGQNNVGRYDADRPGVHSARMRQRSGGVLLGPAPAPHSGGLQERSGPSAGAVASIDT